MKKIISLALSVLFMLTMFIEAAPAAVIDEIVSTADFTYHSFVTVTGRALISFDLTANTVSDGVICIGASNIIPSDYTDYAICFRIRAGGFFDANNGSSFDKAGNVYYQAGKTYRVEIDADIENQIYNAYVTVDGERLMVADNYGFRASAGDLGKITARGGAGVAAGLYKLENFTAEKGEGSFQTFTLPNYYAENMVLQRDKPHLIFGKVSDATEEVRVTLQKGDLVSSAVVIPENGRFEARLSILPASLEPYTLTVSAADKTQIISSVYIGDVFLLAGQSNMAQNYNYQTTEQLGGGITTSNLPARVSDERIKHFTINQTAASEPTFDVPFKNGSWQSLTESNNKTLSYIGMFFAMERLNEEPEVPIGLISAAWNGTTINRWMRNSADNQSPNYTPTNGDIFNNHIAPLAQYPLRAVLWYQGESDASNPVAYAEAFPALIRDWRKLWGDESLPFLFVQLARYSGQDYSPQRQAQMAALSEENVGMAVILDTDKGTYQNIHPLGKEEVARRLNLLAKKYAYGQDITAEGPIFEAAEITDGKIIISFRPDTIGGGLVINNTYGASSTKLCEFEIAPADGKYVKADAVINPDNTITLSSTEVPEPVFARYAYSGVPENPNLFNAEGLPASPFTTDTRIFSADSFLTRAAALENAPVQLAEFRAAAFEEKIDGVIAFTDVANTITGWHDCGVSLRFNTNGFFEYIDGASYKTSNISYQAGIGYDMRVLMDFTDNTYSVLVKCGEDWLVMCRKAAFRTDGLTMKNGGRLLVRGGDKVAANQFAIDGYSISNPASGSSYWAKDGDNAICFVVSPSSNVYAASYDKEYLIKAVKTDAADGAAILSVPDADKKKVFLWNDSLSPVM